MNRKDSAFIVAAIGRAVRVSTRNAWLVIAGFVIVAALAAGYVSRHIAITTDSSKLLSSSLPWRQQEIKLNAEFPQRTDRITAVVDAATPEAAEEAAAALASALQPRSDLIRTIIRPDGGAFFARNGVLFLSVDEVRRDTAQLIKAEPFLGTLAADPTLRGVLGAISQSTEGLRLGKTTLEDMKPAMVAISDALDAVAQGKRPAFSWRRLITGRAPEPSDLRRFVNIQPVLDYNDLQPGGKATKAIRETIAKLGLTPENGVTVRLTGSVPLADEEFATVADGAALNGVVTMLVVLLVLWLALKQARIILAVLVNLAIGLILTAAVGLWMVGALNLISVAFAVLFIGLGVDFGIQFSVRFRAERYADSDLFAALQATARGVAGPLLLAAASIAAAFYSFLPTAYVGLSELGLIAGTGMIIALATTVTLLPALLAALKPAGERSAHRLRRARAPRPLPRSAAQLGRRGDAGCGDPWPAAAQGPPLRLQPPGPSLEAGRIGRHAPRPYARSRHDPEHHRDPRERSPARHGACREAARVAGGSARADDRKLHPERPGREARAHRRRQLFL